MGFVDGSNAVGIRGNWYVFADCYDTSAPFASCPAAGFTADQCSRIDAPGAGDYFPPTDAPTATMCMSGVAAQVIDKPGTTTLAWDVIWGGTMALDLNDIPGGPQKNDYDAIAHGVTGFSFSIDTPPPGSLRVEIATADSPWECPFWGGTSRDSSPVLSGVNEFRFDEVGGPDYMVDAAPVDPSRLLTIQFHVISNATNALPFSFCVSELKALRD